MCFVDDKTSDAPAGLCSSLRDSGHCVKEETETCTHSLEVVMDPFLLGCNSQISL